MNNIGRLLLIVGPLVASLIILFPTFQAQLKENEYEEAKQRAEQSKDSTLLRQLADKFEPELKELRKNSIKLGLDLRGGMYVMLEVDVVKLLEESAIKESVDEAFMQVLDRTRKETENTDESVMTVFMRNFKEIAGKQGKSLLNYFELPNTQEVTEQKIIDKLQADIDGAIDQAKEVVRQRIDKYGVSEPNITKQGARRIVIELPGVKNESEMRQLLQTTARLEFKLVRNNTDILRAFYRIDEYLSRTNKQVNRKPDTAKVALADSSIRRDSLVGKDGGASADSSLAKADSSKADSAAAAIDSAKLAGEQAAKDTANPYAGLSQDKQREAYQKDHPFSSLIVVQQLTEQSASDPIMFYNVNQIPAGDFEFMFLIPEENLKAFTQYLADPGVQRMIPADLEIARSAKSIRENQATKIFEVYGLKREAELRGDVVSDARASKDPMSGRNIVNMEMNDEGAQKWSTITGANIKKKIAIVLDGQVYSAPVVQNKITGGSSQITGMDSPEEARLLQIVLKAGALQAPVRIIEERIVGPSLGEDSINRGLIASGVAILLVIAYMLFYYSTAGMFANLAVLINVSMILAIMTPLVIKGGGTLTLPGIAGIILTIGMAVDANILSYERIREELAHGRTLKSAIAEGYTRALSAILDSNVTSFMTGLILYFLGTGPVQGFALTLMIGILTTLFTAMVLSRAMIDLTLANGRNVFFGQTTKA